MVEQLDKALLLKIYDEMLKARMLDERLIRMFQQDEGYFWIGGPGEEAFSIPLGLLLKKGQGLDHDFLHFHYRSGGIFSAMGAEPIDMLRQMKNTATDPFSGGRAFSSHYTKREWNLTPITSPIETQYLIAIGTGIAQQGPQHSGITIVNGGDAGTAEGDFASCLIWASRPGNELPMLIIVNNNQWGISTSAASQHGEKSITDRGKAFGMKTMVVNGNDAEESYHALTAALDYVRTERKPLLLETFVSRLHGHSSASGANRNKEEVDSVAELEKVLLERQWTTQADIDARHQHYLETFRELANQIKTEPQPDPASIYDYTYYQQTGKYW